MLISSVQQSDSVVHTYINICFPGGSDGKEYTFNSGDLISIPGLGRSSGGGHGNPLQHSCLENPHGQRSYGPWGPKETQLSDQAHRYKYILIYSFFTFSPIIGYYKILSRVPCAIQQVLVYFTYSSVCVNPEPLIYLASSPSPISPLVT